MIFVHASLCFALVQGAPPQGQTINARDGDLVVVNPTSAVKVMRRGDANVRAIYDPAQRSLIWLVDYVAWDGRAPDGRVDTAYRFEGVSGSWPLGERWEGRAVVEDYSVIGGAMGAQGAGLRASGGLVQLFGPLGPSYGTTFEDKTAVATLSYQGGGRGTAGEVPFDVAESREKESMARNAERRANPGAAGPGSLTFMINGVPVSSTSGAPPPPAAPGAPVRVGGNIRAPKKIVDAAPVMPELAKRVGIQGVVILEITIAPDGTVSDAKVLRSIEMLDQAAIAAVRQWRYEPTLLNGTPVPVIMTATVNFR